MINALRFFSIIKDKKITIDIPPDFTSKNVEIIILSYTLSICFI